MATMSRDLGSHDSARYDLDGRMGDDGVHVYPVRVFYEDTDAGGIVYHANYLRFMERARTSLLRLAGWKQSEIVADTGVAFAVRRMTIDFVAPAKLDDTLEVLTKIIDTRGASFAAAQWIMRGDQKLVGAEIQVAAVTAGRAARLPAAMRQTLEKMTMAAATPSR
ncbi:MAG TPA: tol-pal system-associated acyl-CoA thioesterase [Azospirillaceae bacterium]|nr:tol-pal system-associated acyl-CoA thioesterase [Azospirillaceae bacterium]